MRRRGVHQIYECKDFLNSDNDGVADERLRVGQSSFSGESGWGQLISSPHTASHQQSDLGQVTHPKGLLISSPDTLRVVPPHATGDICQTVSFLLGP